MLKILEENLSFKFPATQFVVFQHMFVYLEKLDDEILEHLNTIKNNKMWQDKIKFDTYSSMNWTKQVSQWLCSSAGTSSLADEQNNDAPPSTAHLRFHSRLRRNTFIIRLPSKLTRFLTNPTEPLRSRSTWVKFQKQSYTLGELIQLFMLQFYNLDELTQFSLLRKIK